MVSVLQAIHRAVQLTRGRGVLVVDRGFHAGLTFEDWLEHQYRFVTRLVGNRCLLRFCGDFDQSQAGRCRLRVNVAPNFEREKVAWFNLICPRVTLFWVLQWPEILITICKNKTYGENANSVGSEKCYLVPNDAEKA